MSGRSASPSAAVLVRRLQRICRDSGRSHPGPRRNRYGSPNLSWSARRCRTFHRLSGECRIEGVPRLIDKSLPGRSDPAPGDPLGRRSDHRRGADRARSLAMGTVRASGVHSYMDRDFRLERRDRDVRHRVRVVDHWSRRQSDHSVPCAGRRQPAVVPVHPSLRSFGRRH
jgi:hypothetical protein